MKLTCEYLKGVLSYCPETGVFTWKVDRGLFKCAGKVAGSMSGKSNSSGVVGVRFRESRNKWSSYIGVNGKTMFLGLYDNLLDAVSARKSAENNLWTLATFKCSEV